MNLDDAESGHAGEPIELAQLSLSLTDRRIAVVAGATTATTVADVAAAIGVGRRCVGGRRITVDGRPVAAGQLLLDSGIRDGSRIDVASADDRLPEPGGRSLITAVWLRGVDCGGRNHLGIGRHFVGRARTATVRCDDPALELHHAVVDVEPDGSVVVSQLAGLHPVLLDGTMIVGPTTVHPGQRLEVGGSVLTFLPPLEPDVDECPIETAGVRRPIDPWRTPWVRSPRQRTPFEPEPIQAPRPAATPTVMHGGLLPAIIGVAGAAVLALVFDQMMFLLFGAMGAVVAVGTWLAQRLGLVRSRRSAAAADRSEWETFVAKLAEQRDACRRSMLADSITIDRAVATIAERSSTLWDVRATDEDAYRVSIGEVDGSWQPVVSGLDDVVGNRPPNRSSGGWGDSRDLINAIENASRLGTVPAAVSLAAGNVVAIVGDSDAFAVARSMIVQLAAASGPADWRLLVISDRTDEWQAVEWLPHLIGAERFGRIIASEALTDLITALDPTDPRHLLVVVDGPELLSARTSSLRRLLAGSSSVACIVTCATESDVPAICTSALVIGRRGSARWIADMRAGSLADPVRIAGLSVVGAFDAAASLAGLTDPELAHGAATLAREVRMIDLLGADIGRKASTLPTRIAASWSANCSDPPLSTPIGLAADGVIEIDLGRDGPHALIAGTTGAGKSELLRSLVVGLAARCSPEQVSFVLIDYKGGSTFDACAALPHTVGVVTDLDDRLAGRALRSLEAELRRREVLLRAAGAGDLSAYRAAATDGGPPPVLPRLVVVIDEFAGLAVQQPDFIRSLLGVAQRGRSLGVHLVLATQRPSGVISDDIRANTNLRIALRVQDPADSTDVVGDAAAAYLPRSTPGRAVMRLGSDELIDFQAATCTGRRRHRAPSVALTVRTFDSLSARGGIADVVADASGDASDLDLIVDAIRNAARSAGIAMPYRPWLDPLSAEMGIDGLAAEERGSTPRCDATGDPMVGIVDDPDHQTRKPLTWPAQSGHLLLIGAPGSGTTTALLELAATLESSDNPADASELYIIDANGDQRWDVVGGVGGVSGWASLVRIHEGERLLRLLNHL